MKERPYFKFYPSDWITSVNVSLMDHEQRGAFLHLLCLCWMQEDCAFVAGAKQLLSLCHWTNTSERFEVVEKMFVKHPKCDGLTNLRLYEEFLKCSTYSELQAKKGKRGGLARAKHRLSNGLAKPKPKRSQIEIEIESESSLILNLNSSSSQSVKTSEEEQDVCLNPEIIRQQWNRLGLVECRTLPETLSKKLQVRIRQHPTREWWNALFLRVQASDWLSGRNKENWAATLDWVCGPVNLGKIEAGNYDNRASGMKRMMQQFMERQEA